MMVKRGGGRTFWALSVTPVAHGFLGIWRLRREGWVGNFVAHLSRGVG